MVSKIFAMIIQINSLYKKQLLKIVKLKLAKQDSTMHKSDVGCYTETHGSYTWGDWSV